MAYDGVNWTPETSINVNNLNKMDQGIKNANKLGICSTEEQVVGTWIDGKPIYRKVVKTTTPSKGKKQTVDFQNNVDTMLPIKSYSLQSANGGVSLTLPYIVIGTSIGACMSLCAYYDRTNKQLVIENVGVDFMQGESCLICEYTKTTD